MNNLEVRIKSHKQDFYKKFEKRAEEADVTQNNVKTGFTDGWDKGWGNHGGPPLKKNSK